MKASEDNSAQMTMAFTAAVAAMTKAITDCRTLRCMPLPAIPARSGTQLQNDYAFRGRAVSLHPLAARLWLTMSARS